MRTVIQHTCPECGTIGQTVTENYRKQQSACSKCGCIFSLFIVDMAKREDKIGRQIAQAQLKRIKKDIAEKCHNITLKMKIVKAENFKNLSALLYANTSNKH